MYSLFQLCTCSGLCQCTSDSCYIIQKKKKKKKNDPYFGMGKNTKVMPQNPLLSIFFLRKGRESFVSDFIKTKTT